MGHPFEGAKKLIALTVLSMLLFSHAAQAEFSISGYNLLKNMSGNERFIAYLDGTVNGLTWANASLQYRDLPLLYCQPPKLTINADNVIELLDGYLERNRELVGRLGDPALGMVMILAPQDAFPCNTGSEEK